MDYIDIEAREREKFLALDGIGDTTATFLVERYELFDHAVSSLLRDGNSWPGELGRSRTDEIRDALQDAGYQPPCECEHYENVRYSQARDDVLAHCGTCGTTLTEYVEGPTVRLDLAGGT